MRTVNGTPFHGARIPRHFDGYSPRPDGSVGPTCPPTSGSAVYQSTTRLAANGEPPRPDVEPVTRETLQSERARYIDDDQRGNGRAIVAAFVIGAAFATVIAAVMVAVL